MTLFKTSWDCDRSITITQVPIRIIFGNGYTVFSGARQFPWHKGARDPWSVGIINILCSTLVDETSVPIYQNTIGKWKKNIFLEIYISINCKPGLSSGNNQKGFPTVYKLMINIIIISFKLDAQFITQFDSSWSTLNTWAICKQTCKLCRIRYSTLDRFPQISRFSSHG